MVLFVGVLAYDERPRLERAVPRGEPKMDGRFGIRDCESVSTFPPGNEPREPPGTPDFLKEALSVTL